jgi:hypothetical protein
METINVFLASSEELDYYRMAFGNLIRRLDNIYEKRGVRIRLFEWEDYDAAYNNQSKQEEYNEYARRSDMFIAMFATKANKFTLEEFDVALEEYRNNQAPKIYVYCMDLPEDKVEDSLKSFKIRLKDDLQYYWCRFEEKKRDRMQLHFVMQLQLLKSARMDDLKLEDGVVSLGGLTVAHMNKMKFASANDEYKRLSKEIAELSKDIARYTKLRNRHPSDKGFEMDLQMAKNKYNKLKEEFALHQQLLFDSSKRIAQLQGKRITDRMRRAMDFLEDGEVRKANLLLEDVEKDAQSVFEEFKRSRILTEQKRQNLILSIEELKLRASILISDSKVFIKDRIQQTEKNYSQADEIARIIHYDIEKYIELLFDYTKFLYQYSGSEKDLHLASRLVQMCEDTYGVEHEVTLDSYEIIGDIFLKLGEKEKAKEYYDKAKR